MHGQAGGECVMDFNDDYGNGIEDLLGPEGCLYPDRCCMPGYHWESECHTAEDLEALEKEGKT